MCFTFHEKGRKFCYDNNSQHMFSASFLRVFLHFLIIFSIQYVIIVIKKMPIFLMRLTLKLPLPGQSQVCGKKCLRSISFLFRNILQKWNSRLLRPTLAYCVYQCLKAVQAPCILRLQSPATQSCISFIQENYLGQQLNSSWLIKRHILERSFLLSLRHTG